MLNPGHNGQDATHPDVVDQLVPSGFGQRKPCETTGTATDSGYPEHAFNFDVAIRVRAILVADGVRVRLTRPDDSGVGPCVDRRAADGNAADVAAVVSIHADGAPAAGHGFHVSQDARAPAGPAVDAASRALGVAIHAALVARSGFVPSTYIGADGYFYRTDLAALNLAIRPATFLELGNMKNAGDAAEQTSPDGRARIAAAVAAGIMAYLCAHTTLRCPAWVSEHRRRVSAEERNERTMSACAKRLVTESAGQPRDEDVPVAAVPAAYPLDRRAVCVDAVPAEDQHG
jgi:N-acetylmuramoyl-L-alanine amidase